MFPSPYLPYLPSTLPRIYLSFSFEWPRPDKQQQNKQRTSTALQQQVYQWWTTVSTGQRGGKAPDNFQLNDKLCHYLFSSLPYSPPSGLISFYSGRGTWQSCIEWTLNRLQLYKDRLFVFPSVFPSIFPSVCLKLHARGIRYNHRFVPKIVQVASMSSVATLNSNCNCSSCTIRLFNCYTKSRWHCQCKIIQ